MVTIDGIPDYVKDSINRACEFESLKREQIVDSVSNDKVDLAPERYRLAFREVAADTNERTFISAILPVPSPHSYTLRTFELYHPRLVGDRIEIVNDFETHLLFFLARCVQLLCFRLRRTD